MSLLKGLTKAQKFSFTFLTCIAAVLGYLLYNSTAENIRDQKLVKEMREENLDLSQDIEIVKQKYDNLEKQLKALDNKVVKISHKKSFKKKKLYAAGKSSKKKAHYKKSKVNYKKLYFELKRQCSTGKKSKYTSAYSYRKNR